MTQSNLDNNQAILLEIFLLGRKIRRRIKKMKDKGVSKILTNAILLLIDETDHNISSLAKTLSISISTMSEKISNIQSKGLIKIQQGSDKRYSNIILTPKGKASLKKIKAHFSTQSEKLLSGTTKTEKQVFLKVIRTIQSNLEREIEKC